MVDPAIKLDHRRGPRVNMKELSSAIDAVTKKPGCTVVKMITIRDSKNPDKILFRFSRQTCREDGTKVDRAGEIYDYTHAEFINLHPDCTNIDCTHWWHNLDDLWRRSNDRASIEVQQYAESQGLILSPVAWNTTQSSSLISIWDKIEASLLRYDTPLPDQSHIKLKAHRKTILIDRNDMIPGIRYLLRPARKLTTEPRRLNPANTNEASVMEDVLEKTIYHSHGWTREPLEWHGRFVNEVMEALGESAVPPVDTSVGEHVPTAPGFTKWMESFVRRLLNWFMDAEREYEHVFRKREWQSGETHDGQTEEKAVKLTIRFKGMEKSAGKKRKMEEEGSRTLRRSLRCG